MLAQNLAADHLTQDIKRVFGFSQLEINPSANGETLQLLVDGQSYLLGELGAGLAQFIIILAFLAVRRPAMVLIDEPELNLHPMLQLDLVSNMRAHTEGSLLFATHNLGLARAVAGDIYVFRKKDGECEMRPLSGHPRLSEVLGELSFGGYQELGFSKLLLVEGPHDVTAVREFLRHLGKDRDVVLMPLGGGSMIQRGAEEQLQELKRVTGDISTLIDSDRLAEGDVLAENIQGFVEACHRAGVICHVLERRALENYLTAPAVREVKGPEHRALGPFEALKDCSPRWGKGENARIARAMQVDDLGGTDLGEFLAQI
jgi:energy-coupling factor transporter ATP-binding protein EcfA2